MDFYRALSDKNKLYTILFCAVFIRLVAAIFAQGYAMHDDHILVVDTPCSWAKGFDSGSWFPDQQKRDIEEGTRSELRPQGHSLFYPGLQYAFFSTMHFLGVENPKVQMLINRLIHGGLGVLVVYLCFVLSNLITTSKNARSIAWIAALGWAFPFLSVRNLVEVVGVPFLLGAVILTIKGLKTNSIKLGLFAGCLMALAVSVRYQTAAFLGVLGLIVLLLKYWRLGFSIFAGFVVVFFLIQGLPDWIIWGRPFAEMLEYFGYNLSDARYDYAADLSGQFGGVKYFPVLALITIPILGIFWLFGFFLQWKKQYLLFWPSIAFLVLHLSYVNAQERFIFPIVHIVLILGFIGWQEFMTQSKFWLRFKKLWSVVLNFSWSLNLILLLVLSTYYGKKARVESTYALYQQAQVDFVIQENSVDGFTPLLPLFYADKWNLPVYQVLSDTDFEPFVQKAKNKQVWIYFQGIERIEDRVSNAKKYFKNLTYIGTYEASFLDLIIQKINPVNRNEAIAVFAINP